ncbi:hypothetical protein [Mucilaginibacter panaciglaebae]|uniref:HEAT repeat protein n=1 Tax=Mucilaginibacter panaciglaebae TaxID=502331 RepID=A0ABP7WDN9_9SPHI
MNQNQLIERIKETFGKLKVLELSGILKNEQFNLGDLIAVTHHHDEAIAFRAAWILENLYLQQPQGYALQLGDILNALPAITGPGVKRHYARIVMYATSPKAPEAIKDQLAQLNTEPVVEQLFDWMIDTKVKIAVKVFAAEALFNLRHQHDWIRHELQNQLEFLMRDGSAAIQTRGKKLLKGLS